MDYYSSSQKAYLSAAESSDLKEAMKYGIGNVKCEMRNANRIKNTHLVSDVHTSLSHLI